MVLVSVTDRPVRPDIGHAERADIFEIAQFNTWEQNDIAVVQPKLDRDTPVTNPKGTDKDKVLRVESVFEPA